MHINEQLTDFAIFIFTGTEIDFMAADNGFLGVAFATIWQTVTRGNKTFDDFFNDTCCLRCGWCLHDLFDLFQILIINKGSGKRLAELGAVTIKRIGLDAETP